MSSTGGGGGIMFFHIGVGESDRHRNIWKIPTTFQRSSNTILRYFYNTISYCIPNSPITKQVHRCFSWIVAASTIYTELKGKANKSMTESGHTKWTYLKYFHATYFIANNNNIIFIKMSVLLTR